MQDNTSLPASIRQRLELAQQYLDQGQPQRAETVMQEMARALATAAPELCTLLMAGQMGYAGYQISNSERSTRTNRVEKKVWGMTIGEDIETVTTTRTTTTCYRLIK